MTGASANTLMNTSAAVMQEHLKHFLKLDGFYPSNFNSTIELSVVCGLTALLFLVLRSVTGGKAKPASYPPGPKPIPVLGNALDLPDKQQWVTFAKWGAQYGGIVHVEALGSHIVILNSPKIATDMLEKKGKLYSERPTLMMGGRLVGWEEGPALIGSNDTWAEYRRQMSQFMGTRNKIEKFDSVLKNCADVFLEEIRAAPEKWAEHVGHFSAAIVLKLAYGYQSTDSNDPLVKIVQEAMDNFGETTLPNAFMVDIFPILQYVPSWFPGAGWKRKANLYRATLAQASSVPYEWVKQQLAAGTAQESYVVDQLQSQEKLDARKEYITKWTALGIYSGGADTTVAGIKWFIQALARHPAEQKQAQAEIDAVLGSGHLPNPSDRARLPYVEALYLEALRLYPIAPLALPHVNVEDDVHEGYFIPKGTIVFPNVWQFMRDPETYPDPSTFSPDRFLGRRPQRDPKDFVFGFGRRRCPGIPLADISMWLACASVLAAFEVRAPRDANGLPIVPPVKDSGGTICHPVEVISCNFVQRTTA